MKEAAKQTFAKLFGGTSRTYRVLSAFYHLPWDRKPFLRHVLMRTVFLAEDEVTNAASLLPETLLQNICLEFQPGSVLDVGCGAGRSLDWFLERGLDARGLEGSRLAISKARNPDKIMRWNLERPLDLKRKFDLVWCFEVAEHIRPKYARALVHTMTRHAGKVVLSAAHPGQGGYGHCNEQPPSYWEELFAAHGFRPVEEARSRITKNWGWNPENIMVFERKPVGAPTVAH